MREKLSLSYYTTLKNEDEIGFLGIKKLEVYKLESDKLKKIRRKWLKASKEAKKLTGFDLPVRFKDRGNPYVIASYRNRKILINEYYINYTDSEIMNDDRRLEAMLHEHGPHFIEYFILKPIDNFFNKDDSKMDTSKLSTNEMKKLNNFLNLGLIIIKNKEINELLADKFAEIVLNTVE